MPATRVSGRRHPAGVDATLTGSGGEVASVSDPRQHSAVRPATSGQRWSGPAAAAAVKRPRVASAPASSRRLAIGVYLPA